MGQLADAKVFKAEVKDTKRYNPEVEQKFLRSQVESYQSNILAQNAVASMYEKGEGVEVDLTEALRYYKFAARGGIPPAYYSLGMLCSHNPYAKTCYSFSSFLRSFICFFFHFCQSCI